MALKLRNTVRLIFSMACLLFVGLSAVAAQSKWLDSLDSRLTRAKGPERLTVWVDLVETLHESNPNQAKVYSLEARRVLTDGTDPELVRRLWLYTARADEVLNRYDSLQAHANSLTHWAEKSGHKIGLTDAELVRGIAFNRKRESDSAMVHLTRALAEYQLFGDEFGENYALYFISDVHRIQGNYTQMREILTGLLPKFEAKGDLPKVIMARWGMGLAEERMGNSRCV